MVINSLGKSTENHRRLDRFIAAHNEDGIVELRDRFSEIIPFVQVAWMKAQSLGYDECFDWHFCPRFLSLAAATSPSASAFFDTIKAKYEEFGIEIANSGNTNEVPSKNWQAEIHYRANDGIKIETHDLEKLADLHDLVEVGPRFDTVVKILIDRINTSATQT